MKKDVVYKILDLLGVKISVIINGGASGADTLSTLWANDRGVTCETKYADWRKHGRAAGIVRNAEMLDSGIDLVVAFPGGSGTRDMINRSKKSGIEVVEIKIIDDKLRCVSSFGPDDSVLH